ncbi:MAG: DUF4159 domain-containing protein [Bryobacterales bacterium]
MQSKHRRLLLLLAIGLCAGLILFGQRGGRRGRSMQQPGMGFADETVRAEFFFTRLAYSGYGGRGWGRERWLTDWPEAEYHFMQGVQRLTLLDAADGGRYVSPLSEELFEYPWIYAVEVGGWELSDEEAARLREYLDRGGFLMVDDFHGGEEWEGFVMSMRRVFPDRPIVEIAEQDEVMHVLYDLDERTQIPGIREAMQCLTYERYDGYPGYWRGIYDDDNRLMVVINFNMDLGDAWEHADWPEYPEKMTALAYRFGINYVVYAMTH